METSAESTEYIDLLLKLIHVFPQDWKSLAVPATDSCIEARLHVFVDWSNTAVSFSRMTNRPINDLDATKLKLVVLRGRHYKDLVAAGTGISDSTLWNLEQQGYFTWVGRRGADGKEKDVDESLSLSILEVLHREKDVRTLVVVTGDGQPSQRDRGLGFLLAAESAAKKGWTIEIYAFGHALSRNWTLFQKAFPNQVRVYYLDEFFVE